MDLADAFAMLPHAGFWRVFELADLIEITDHSITLRHSVEEVFRDDHFRIMAGSFMIEAAAQALAILVIHRENFQRKVLPMLREATGWRWDGCLPVGFEYQVSVELVEPAVSSPTEWTGLARIYCLVGETRKLVGSGSVTGARGSIKLVDREIGKLGRLAAQPAPSPSLLLDRSAS